MSVSARARPATTFAILASLAALPDAVGLCSPLFAEHTVLEIELRGPITDLVEAREDREELSFELTVADGQPLPLKVRSRGNSRLGICSFPPLRLDFPKKAVGGTLFEGQNRLKLVTHCNDHRRDAGNVFDEYLAYRIFNLISELSYRVRLARITYTDVARNPGSPQTRAAFIVESDEEFSARTGTEEARIAGIPYARVDHGHAALVYVFQYLIGNTDWSVVMIHNIRLVQVEGHPYFLPVAYDFDWSGVVNASYARPDARLGTRTVRERMYRGACRQMDELAPTLARIMEQRDSIRDAFASLPGLDPKRRDDVLDYLDDGFRMIGRPQDFKHEQGHACARG